MVTASLSVASLVAAFVLGWLTSRYLSGSARYFNPQIHEGSWVRTNLSSTAVEWERVKPDRPRLGPHVHAAVHCVVDNNTNHEDRCSCGATRYGVFGAWSS